MERKFSSNSENGQRNLQALERMRHQMGKAGFVPGSQEAYARALGLFYTQCDQTISKETGTFLPQN